MLLRESLPHFHVNDLDIPQRILSDILSLCLLQEQLSQSRVEVRQQNKGGDGADEESCLRKELEDSREELKQIKSELLRKEYKHDTEMVRICLILHYILLIVHTFKDLFYLMDKDRYALSIIEILKNNVFHH